MVNVSIWAYMGNANDIWVSEGFQRTFFLPNTMS